MSATLFALLAVPLFAFLGRFWGGEVEFKGKKAAMLAAAVGGGFLAGGVCGAGIGLAWFVYRSPGWKVFGGSATPVSGREIAGTFARHALALLAVLPAFWAHKDAIMAAGLFGAYALAATSLAVAYGRANRAAQEAGEPIDQLVNIQLELARGAAFGLAAALVLH